ncbi:hypothetical protein A6302_00673 [Methylobrevis pamukkalensis]|uniref:Uncharacterized protein n=1 Tax=Methylobrevis pamukkalensis TaxID=1439726 RepID=A0A1E3H8X1_9HYPH|nr:hypothetical protein A6302_00673 [Methylobrevis pamukkalensis]
MPSGSGEHGAATSAALRRTPASSRPPRGSARRCRRLPWARRLRSVAAPCAPGRSSRHCGRRRDRPRAGWPPPGRGSTGPVRQARRQAAADRWEAQRSRTCLPGAGYPRPILRDYARPSSRPDRIQSALRFPHRDLDAGWEVSGGLHRGFCAGSPACPAPHNALARGAWRCMNPPGPAGKALWRQIADCSSTFGRLERSEISLILERSLQRAPRAQIPHRDGRPHGARIGSRPRVLLATPIAPLSDNLHSGRCVGLHRDFARPVASAGSLPSHVEREFGG